MKKLFSLILCACVLIGALPALPASAAENTIEIGSAQEFLTFAKNCRLDSYSNGLSVKLTADIDLQNTDFSPIPYFGGKFDGNGHKIALKLTPNGSNQGLFRYLGAGAEVSDLTVTGSVSTTGSVVAIGGIAGQNSGSITRCSVQITLSGSTAVGGICGINTVSGIVQNCTAGGNVSGIHSIGGVAGINFGVVRDCENRVRVNTLMHQNQVGLGNISLDSILGSEAANTVTDIGGIAGQNSGVIKNCINNAPIGYRQMGYNIGGIAGSHSGYIVNCKNFGEINGRKEVGGIVGQAEPVTQIDFDRDTLQQLQGQIDGINTLTHSAANGMQNAAQNVQSGVLGMQDDAKAAADAIETLLPGSDGTAPDDDTVKAAQNALSGSLASLQDKSAAMAGGAVDSAGSVVSAMTQIAKRMENINRILENADSGFGVSLEDVSDKDTQNDTTGKTQNCVNFAAVKGDLNIGGIVGAMSIENEFDHEDDLNLNGSLSLNVSSKLRAVVLGCENKGDVTANKQNAGGIVGYQSIGLVKQNANTGKIDSQSADYVGGIAGRSSAYLRQNSAKCVVNGKAFVGGIAGLGGTVTDNRSMCKIDGSEKLGEVLGDMQKGDVKGNLYLPTEGDLGGVDGISYDGKAKALESPAFLALEGLSELFKTTNITFVFGDKTEQILALTPGDDLKADMVPPVPQRDGYEGYWEGLDKADLSGILFDMTFVAAYDGYDTALAADVSENGKPVLLLQGSFAPGTKVNISLIDYMPKVDGRDVICGYGFGADPEGEVSGARVLIPEGENGQKILVYVGSPAGQRQAKARIMGSYLVFELTNEDTYLLLAKAPDFTWVAVGGIMTAAAVAVVIGFTLHRKKKMQQTPKEENVTV